MRSIRRGSPPELGTGGEGGGVVGWTAGGGAGGVVRWGGNGTGQRVLFYRVWSHLTRSNNASMIFKLFWFKNVLKEHVELR